MSVTEVAEQVFIETKPDPTLSLMVDNAVATWKIVPFAQRLEANEEFFGLDAEPGPIVGVIGDGVASATVAAQLVKNKYRVLVFGDDPGGQAFNMIDELDHHNPRIGGVRIAAGSFTQPGILYIPQRVDMNKLHELADDFSLSGIVVAIGGTENKNKNVNYALPGVMGMWDFIGAYHQHMNQEQPLALLDLGLPYPPEKYPGLRVMVQGAGRGVEDIVRKWRFLQAAALAYADGKILERDHRSELFETPREITNHRRMMHNLRNRQISVDSLAPGVVIHRGLEADFKWQEPNAQNIKWARAAIEAEPELKAAYTRLVKANPEWTEARLLETFIRKFDPIFREKIQSEVTEWLQGYQMGFLGNSEIISTTPAHDGGILVIVNNSGKEEQYIVDVLITSLGSNGIKLPIEEIREKDGTFVSAQLERSNGQIIPVELAGMSYDGRGKITSSVSHAKEVSLKLVNRMSALGSNNLPDKSIYTKVITNAKKIQKQKGFYGDVMQLLVGNPSRRGAFSEFLPSSV